MPQHRETVGWSPGRLHKEDKEQKRPLAMSEAL